MTAPSTGEKSSKESRVALTNGASVSEPLLLNGFTYLPSGSFNLMSNSHPLQASTQPGVSVLGWAGFQSMVTVASPVGLEVGRASVKGPATCPDVMLMG